MAGQEWGLECWASIEAGWTDCQREAINAYRRRIMTLSHENGTLQYCPVGPRPMIKSDTTCSIFDIVLLHSRYIVHVHGLVKRIPVEISVCIGFKNCKTHNDFPEYVHLLTLYLSGWMEISAPTSPHPHPTLKSNCPLGG